MAKSVAKSLQDLMKSRRGWVVCQRGQDIQMVRNLSGRAVIINLRKQKGRKKYILEFPSYIFESKISHWGPSQDEVRMCRNKNMMISLVRALKRTAAWNIIDNQHFLTINTSNPYSNKIEVRKQLKDLYNYDPDKKKGKRKTKKK